MMRERLDLKKILILTLIACLLPACIGGGDDATSTPVESPISDESIVVPTPSPTPTVVPTPTTAPWVGEIMTPGPAAGAPPSVFFLNGPDVWIINQDLTVSQVTSERRVSVVSTAPSGEQAAVVFLETVGGRAAEEIRIIDRQGSESQPIYGPEIVENPGGNPQVRELVWSPDGATVAVVREDGSVWLAGPEREPEELVPSDGNVERLVWTPNSTAVAVLEREPGGAGTIGVLPVDGGGRLEIEPATSFGDLGWIPGQALIVVSEDRMAGSNPAAGSLFTLQPDGSERALLLSAGEFGPVVEITRIRPSPDGTLIAFVVNAPNSDGEFEFQDLYLLEYATGVLRRLSVATGQGVSDLWWFAGGLAWRATEAEPEINYDGVEPFVLEVANLETGETQLIYTAE